MTTNYSPTVNPGDTRRRTRYINISVPLNDYPTVSTQEQDIVLLASGERVLEELNKGLRITIEDLNESVELRNPTDDSLLGQTITIAEIMAGVYSWVRKKQLERDLEENN